MPDDAVGVLFVHILQIAIHRRYGRIGECIGDALQYPRIRIHIVGMQEAEINGPIEIPPPGRYAPARDIAATDEDIDAILEEKTRISREIEALRSVV